MGFVTMERNSTTSWESKQHLASKKGLLAIARIVENDFTNIGSAMVIPSGSVVSLDTTSTIRDFQFYSRTDPAIPDSQLVSFKWQNVGTAEAYNGTTLASIPVFQISRFVDGVLRGNSISTISDIRIDLRDELNGPVGIGNYPDTRSIEISVELVSPLGPSKLVQENKWTKVFRPVKLNPSNTSS